MDTPALGIMAHRAIPLLRARRLGWAPSDGPTQSHDVMILLLFLHAENPQAIVLCSLAVLSNVVAGIV